MTSIELTVGLPLATKWVEKQERRILAEGVPLTPHQAFDGYLAGVKATARIRLLKVDCIPLPDDPILRRANDLMGLVSPFTAGITFGHGIYVRADRWGDRQLVAHELVHVAQYERYGSINAFLHAYLDECLTIGYPDGPLEQEAIARTREICS